jgi:hypothetical protein
MKTVIVRALLIGACLVTAPHAFAQTVTYLHNDRAMFDITYPDGWKVEFMAPSKPGGARTLAGGPADRFVWVGFWAVPDAKSLDDARDMLQTIAESVVSDAKQVGKSEAGTVNGMPVRYYKGTGTFAPKDSKRKKRPLEFVAMLFEPSPGTYCAGVYLGPPETLKSVEPALNRLVNSLRPSTR